MIPMQHYRHDLVAKRGESWTFVVAKPLAVVQLLTNIPATLPVRSAHQGGCFFCGGPA